MDRDCGTVVTVANLRRLLPWVWAVLTLFAVGWAFHVLQRYSLADIGRALRAMKMERMALAGLCASGSYGLLTIGDLLAVRAQGCDMPYRRVGLAAFVSLSIGHTLGFAPFSSGAIRYRFYRRWGLSAEQVAKIMLFSAFTIGFGEAGLDGLVFLTNPAVAASILGLPRGAVRAIAAPCLAIPAAYVSLAVLRRESFRVFRWCFQLPPWRIAALQVVVGIANFALVAAALQQAILSNAPIGFMATATAYLSANIAALISNAPGGVGVIEAMIIKLLPKKDVLGAVLSFRVIYFLIPFVIGGLIFLLVEVIRRTGAAPASSQADRKAPAQDSAG
jgi:uncharacterized membrane protein YbhN (UPF0104 family)